MRLFKKWLAGFVRLLEITTFSPLSSDHGMQESLMQPSIVHSPTINEKPGPIFSPPNAGDKRLKCDYTAEKDYKDCNTPQNRGCWLRGLNGEEFNITTNYETLAPKGVTRRYMLNVTDMDLAPDGYRVDFGKVFNKTYPGPWIEACWGDDIEIKVTNYLENNGTTIHWHGIRQNGTLDMDGVNGVTQCPIATDDSFTYKFKATQYGTSWYHSHYSLQYADGLLGPMTIYGPSSANYDEAVEPILMTDWSHRSAFKDFYLEMGGSRPLMTTSLMNGRGSWEPCTAKVGRPKECTDIPQIHTTVFEEGKKYLLRLINTSVDSTWIFSIDYHTMQVVGNDFVPLEPYKKNHLLVGIGQRYHVIVEATHPLPDDEYWMRMTVAEGCSGFNNSLPPKDERGILRYNASSSRMPTTKRNTFGNTCADEPYDNLKPILPWKVGKPSNEQHHNTFEVGFSPFLERPPWPNNISRWQMGNHPLWVNFSDPTILNLETDPEKQSKWQTDKKLADKAVVSETNANSPESWIYLMISATKFPFSNGERIRKFVPAAHPIHLHGHDFAILKQSKTPYWDGLVDMKFDNPPRRDVALLPAGGYLIIAFKADNPGAWLLHCHIAWHASSGLALQIMEREGSIGKTIGEQRMSEVGRVCDNWNDWLKTHELHQDDSGV